MITVFVTVLTPSQINVIHTLPNHLFKTHFNIITTVTSSSPGYFLEIFWKVLLLISLP